MCTFRFCRRTTEKVTDLQTSNDIITVIEPPCVVDIHRFICANHVSLWMERR
jgi:hypothetical protein